MKNNTNKFTIIPELLSITTHVKHIHYFSLATSLVDVVSGKTKLDIKFNIQNKLIKPSKLSHRLDHYWGCKNTDTIYYDHPIIFNLRAKMLIVFGKNPSIIVNKSYNLFSRFKFENVWPPGINLMILSIISLLENNLAIIHAGALMKKNNQGILLFGASNTGKSFTTSKGIKNGYSLMSEDMIASDGKSVYACPLLSAYSNILPEKSYSLKISNFIASIPFIGLFIPRIPALKSFNDFVKNYSITEKATVKYIFIMERKNCKTDIKKISSKEAYEKILTLNRMELPYFKSDLVYAYSYFNKDFNVNRLMETEENIIKKMVQNASCYIINSNDPADFYKLIDKLVGAN